MVWTQFKILFPSFMFYWFMLVALATVCWWGITKVYHHFHFRWEAPAIVGTCFSFYMIGTTLVGYYQNQVVANYRDQQVAANNQTQQNQPQQKLDPANQLKANFLNGLAGIVNAPEKATPEAKDKLFKEYAELFKDPAAKEEYVKNIGAVLECDKFFWEDAFASFKSGKAIRSDSRKDCENAEGKFFLREKLMMPEDLKARENTLQKLLTDKRLPASQNSNDTVVVNEKMLRDRIEAEGKKIETLKKLFK